MSAPQSTHSLDKEGPPPEPSLTSLEIAGAMIPQFLMPGLDTDEEMGNAQEATTQTTPPHKPPTQPPKAGAPSTSSTIRVPGPISYANALKCTAQQAGDDSLEEESGKGEQPNKEVPEEIISQCWPQGAASGPIKGFCVRQIMENLNPVV